MSIIGSGIDTFTNNELWTEEALCRQTGIDDTTWFPDKWSRSADAKRICAACPVSAECLEYAMRTKERYGVWGGLNSKERDELRSRGRQKKPFRHRDGCVCAICRKRRSA